MVGQQFIELSSDADVVSVHKFACVYIMQLMEKILFVDMSNILVPCVFFSLLSDFDQAGTYTLRMLHALHQLIENCVEPIMHNP